jgi:hypothetical protein
MSDPGFFGCCAVAATSPYVRSVSSSSCVDVEYYSFPFSMRGSFLYIIYRLPVLSAAWLFLEHQCVLCPSS